MYFKKLYSRFLYFFGNWPEKVSAFQQDLLCRSEKTTFHVSIEIFRGEFVGKKTFCHFWTMSKNFPLVKTVFYMSRGSFQWSFFWKNVYFSKFLFFERIFSVFGQKIPAGLPELKYTFPQKKLGRRKICWKNCVCAIVFQKWAKTFGPLAKVFRQRCENCFWCVHNINMGIFFDKKDTF